MTNLKITELFRKIAAAYQVLGENRFKIIAYERAADSIEHLTNEAKDLWEDEKLGDVPGIGLAIAQHLDELFRTGKVGYFESTMAKVPASLFPLLSIPGLGPKKAIKLVTALNLKKSDTAISDLEKAAIAHRIAPLENFGEKSEEGILEGIRSFKKGQIKGNRMVLSDADAIASNIIEHLKKSVSVLRADPLGSLRRQVSTIGDIDIAVSTKKPQEAIKWFLRYPHRKIIEQGPTGASFLLVNGRQVDLRVQTPEAYGAMLQYFTGSKDHNIRLREYAQSMGLSLNEYGIKDLRTDKIRHYATEASFYRALTLSYIPPELREGRGEIDASLCSAQGKPNGLPKLVELTDIRGDLHIHTKYDLEPSHDLGVSSLEDYLIKAEKLGYEYIGLSDHNPSITNHTKKRIVDIMKRRKEHYEQRYSSWIHKLSKNGLSSKNNSKIKIFIMCEVDILANGELALPSEAFEYVDAVIVSVHSSFTSDKKHMTDRIIGALKAHPKVKIFGHPTGRLLGKREGYELEWKKVFTVCKEYGIAMEINAYPQRLDLPDSIVPDAISAGLTLCINTDSHATDQMDLLRYGVSVARRGWARSRDIVNTMDYNSFTSWLKKEE